MSEIQGIKDQLNRIETAICGDECRGIEGIVKRVDRHDKEIKVVQKLIWMISGGVFVISVLWQIFVK